MQSLVSHHCLFAFDLDGTLLTSEKLLTKATIDALRDIHHTGHVIALASGRLGSSMAAYLGPLGIDTAMLTLNGAAVFLPKSMGGKTVYAAPLNPTFAEKLITYPENDKYVKNFYINGKLYAAPTPASRRWCKLYHAQTATPCEIIPSLTPFIGSAPSKIIFVGDAAFLDKEERAFRSRWDSRLYIVRTWHHYLEFLNKNADKGRGLCALAKALHIDMAHTIAFGDGDNDIPLLQAAGIGIAPKNAAESVQAIADRVSTLSNDEDFIAREWERLRD